MKLFVVLSLLFISTLIGNVVNDDPSYYNCKGLSCHERSNHRAGYCSNYQQIWQHDSSWVNDDIDNTGRWLYVTSLKWKNFDNDFDAFDSAAQPTTYNVSIKRSFGDIRQNIYSKTTNGDDDSLGRFAAFIPAIGNDSTDGRSLSKFSYVMWVTGLDTTNCVVSANIAFFYESSSMETFFNDQLYLDDTYPWAVTEGTFVIKFNANDDETFYYEERGDVSGGSSTRVVNSVLAKKVWRENFYCDSA